MVMQCQGAARRHRDRLREHRHVHVPRPPVGVHRARLDGLLRGRRLMETRAADAGRRRVGWRLLGARARSCCSRSSSARSSRRRLVARRPDRHEPAAGRRVRRPPGRVPARARSASSSATRSATTLTIASVTVDDAIVPFTVDGPATLGRLRSSTIVVPYDWVEDEPIAVGSPARPASRRRRRSPPRSRRPTPSARGFLGYALIGFLVGVVPVALGLLWLPSLRRADARWLAAFMALTAGLLTFLGVEALSEAFELQAALPGALGGAGPRAARRRAQLPRR